jgi:hypothetical protein
VLPVIAGFHRDWARLWQLDGMSKDPELYPEWGPDLMGQMVTELDLFTTEVVWLGDGTFDALLYSDVTWTTADLDAIYGISQERVAEWQRTTLDPWERPGVLSRTAFLTSHGYSATPAPVRRGAFVVKQMLCQDLVPPANVDMNLPEPSEGETIRDRLAAHRADPACAGCHEKIDPVGFSMEHYGAIGEWRDAYHDGLAIDATGSLVDPAGEFDGLSELLGVVDAELDARDCYAEQWFEYAVGRAVMETDFCGLAQVQDRFALADGDLRELLVAVTQTDAFLYRPVVEVE